MVNRGIHLYRKFIFILLVLVLFLLLPLYVCATTEEVAEEDTCFFQKITVKDGLSQSDVKSIIQDSYGYMWFGTIDGLNMYDGEKFTIYKFNGENEKSLGGSYIEHTVEDANGNIWVATNNGLSKISNDREIVTNYFCDEKDLNSISGNKCNYVYVDSKERVWIGSKSGIDLYNETTDNFERYTNSEDKNFNVTTIKEDDKGVIWIGTKGGLFYIHSDSKEIKKVMTIDDKDEITSLCCSKKSELWVGIRDKGLKKINLTSKKSEFINTESRNYRNLPSNNILNMMEDKYGNMWFATDSGLSKLTYDKFITYTYDKDEDRSLSSNRVHTIYEDKSSLIWVGTSDGINMLNPKVMFKYYNEDSFKNNNLSSNYITGVYEDKDQILWVGTIDKGLNEINMDNGNIINHIPNKTNEGFLSDRTVWNITGDKKGNIWIATNKGLNNFNKNTRRFKVYLKDEYNDNTIISNLVKAVEMDKNGLLWIGTEEGLCTLDKENNFKSYVQKFEESGIQDTFIQCIYEGKDGVMWFGLGNYGGLVKYDTINDTINVYTHDPNDSNSISNNSVNCINSDKEGNLWIGTEYGLNKFDIKNEIFIKYVEEQGLKNSYIYGILTDSDNNIWVSTNLGISKFNAKYKRFKNFNESDGLQEKEFNLYAYCKQKNGNLIFGGINGINIVEPIRTKKSTYIPKVVLQNIQVNGLPVAGNSELKNKYKDNNISLEFFFPDFRNRQKVQYLYKLEGLDKNWHFTSDRKYVNYVNLPSGKYKFLVKARGSETKWSNPSYLDITINNPPWASAWAYCVYAMLLIVVGLIVVNYFTSLDKLVTERTKELKSQLDKNNVLYNKLIATEKYKNNYFINLSHELRTPLNVILSTEQLICNINKSREHIDKSKLDYYMSVLRRNSKRLLNLINNIIDTSKIDTGSYKIDCKEVDIIYLVEEVALSMKDFIQNNGIELIIDPEVEEMNIYCDAVDIERCIVNLIGNAAKFTGKGGSIFVKVEDKYQNVHIIVEDTGIGIEDKYKESIFDRFSQSYEAITEVHGGSGLGLTLTRQLVELHEGVIWVESEVGVGSKFIIELPKRLNNIVCCKK